MIEDRLPQTKPHGRGTLKFKILQCYCSRLLWSFRERKVGKGRARIGEAGPLTHVAIRVRVTPLPSRNDCLRQRYG